MQMFNSLRVAASRVSTRAFSSSPSRSSDVAKLILVGSLLRNPELRLTKNDKEYVMYTVATNNYPPPPLGPNGERRPSTSTFHRVISFNEHNNRYLQTLNKGTKVYVEANFELREPEAGADPSTPQGQRQIFLRHENLRVLSWPRRPVSEDETQGTSEAETSPSS